MVSTHQVGEKQTSGPLTKLARWQILIFRKTWPLPAVKVYPVRRTQEQKFSTREREKKRAEAIVENSKKRRAAPVVVINKEYKSRWSSCSTQYRKLFFFFRPVVLRERKFLIKTLRIEFKVGAFFHPDGIDKISLN